MNTQDVIRLYNTIINYNLTPNEYFYILLKLNNIKDQSGTDLTKRILIKNGWLDLKGNLTNKSLDCLLFNDINIKKEEIVVDDVTQNIIKYREIFPKGRLPSGKMARSSIVELQAKFKWFFDNHPYTWEDVFNATHKYVEYFERQNYKFMQTSSFFIYKTDVYKVRTSSLAEACDQYKNKESESSYDINV